MWGRLFANALLPPSQATLSSHHIADLFNYFNSVGSQLPNCEAHVDRGFLHAIVASPVDGLELQSNADGTWHAPHALWPQITPHAHAVVFVNDALAQLSESWSPAAGARADEPRSRHDEPLVACTHRVVRSKAGPVPRLSISYELRPAADAEPEAWSAVRGSALLTPPYR
jgi:isopenicillin N synthase-like dioxygenase